MNQSIAVGSHAPGFRIPGPGALLLACGTLFLAGTTLLLAEASMAAAEGYRVERLEQQKTTLHRQIAQLQAEVGGLRSLDRIEGRARNEMKMVTPDRYLYVTVDRLPQTPTPLLQKSLKPPEEAAPPRQKSWWESLSTVLFHR
ncbi:MAG: hypothetical protein AAB289_07360 [Chloroflexota bacterium]